MRTGLRDSALRRVRSVAARQRGMPSLAEVPAQEGTAQGQGERRGGGPFGRVVAPGLPRISPATCRECHLIRQQRAKGLTVSLAPFLFLLGLSVPKGQAGREAAPLGTALSPPSCPRGKKHQIKAEPSSRGAASSARHSPSHGPGSSPADGICRTGVGRCYATLWYYSGFVSLRPRPAPPALPLLLLCARRWRGREEAQSRRVVPSIPTSHFAKGPDDLV